jgi:hypothetical protein
VIVKTYLAHFITIIQAQANLEQHLIVQRYLVVPSFPPSLFLEFKFILSFCTSSPYRILHQKLRAESLHAGPPSHKHHRTLAPNPTKCLVVSKLPLMSRSECRSTIANLLQMNLTSQRWSSCKCCTRTAVPSPTDRHAAPISVTFILLVGPLFCVFAHPN